MSAAPPIERDLGRFGGGKLDRLDVEIRRLVEAARLDQFDLPGGRSGLLDRDAQSVGGFGAGGETRAHREREAGDEDAFDHEHSLVSAAHHPPRRISMPRAGS